MFQKRFRRKNMARAVLLQYIVYMAVNLVTSRTLSNVTDVATPTGDVSFMATPPRLVRGLTNTLELTCSYTQRGAAPSGVTSLVIYKADSVNDDMYSELATVTYFSQSVDVKQAAGASHITGAVVSSGRSYVQLKWDYPGPEAVGKYRCDVYIMAGGRTMARSTTVTVEGEEPGMDDFREHLKHLDILLTNQTSTLSDVITTLTNHTAQLQQIEDLTERLERLEKTNDPDWSNRLTPVAQFKGHQYYLSEVDTISDVYEGLELCQSLGGYLAEVDDDEERVFILDFVKNRTIDDYIYLGSHDIDGDGKWHHFRNNKPLTYKPNKLDGSNNEKCAAIQNRDDIDDYKCKASSPKQCLCEKSF